MTFRMLSIEDKLSEIRRLYFSTSKRTIDEDLAKALELLKSMHSEEERGRVAVYMHGLNEMRREWSGGKGNSGKIKSKSKNRTRRKEQ